jgi:hypothetical protein
VVEFFLFGDVSNGDATGFYEGRRGNRQIFVLNLFTHLFTTKTQQLVTRNPPFASKWAAIHSSLPVIQGEEERRLSLVKYRRWCGSDVSRAGQFLQDNARAMKTVFDDAAHGERNMINAPEAILRNHQYRQLHRPKSLTK